MVTHGTYPFFADVSESDWQTMKCFMEQNNKAGANSTGYRDRKMGNIGTASESPVMGIIAPERLSGGVKTLLLIDNMPEKLFNASNCGDNCASWLLRIGEEKDVLINLRHIMDFGDDEFEILIMNTNTIVHNMDELVRIAGRYV